jgi:diaminopimelate epimerase
MISFTKYHGCGNDFVLVDENAITVGEADLPSLAERICSRHVGVGADGLIIVKNNPLEMVIYNSDGSRAPMCGNGIRCFAQHCIGVGLVAPDVSRFSVDTMAGQMHVRVVSLNPYRVEIDMGKPNFDRSVLGIDPAYLPEGEDMSQPFLDKTVEVLGRSITFSAVFTGTIHVVIWVGEKASPGAEDFAKDGVWRRVGEVDFEVDEDIVRIGKALSNHPLFAEKTNVNFVKVLDRTRAEMITYERGAGLTSACGTGSCAALVLGAMEGRLDKSASFLLPHGRLDDRLAEGRVYMEGPSEKVFTGEYERNGE